MKLLCLTLLALCTLAAAPLPPARGIASWYGQECAGRLMANGRPFNPAALTCASWHHPFGTQLRVSNPANGRSVIVIVTDRGPHRRLNRAIDLSQSAFARIADPKLGLVRVHIRRNSK
jgi:rare lipoprotein A